MSSVESGKIILASNEARVSGKTLSITHAIVENNKLTFGVVGQDVNVNAGKYTYRQFYLYNQDGDFLNLNESPMMFLAPEGLGANLSPSSNDLSNGFFRVTDKDKIPQGNIVGDILFSEIVATANSSYQSYRNFVDFVMGAERLYLGYIPGKNLLTALEEYHCEVAFDYINKGQINWSRCIKTPVSFKMLTPWYKTTTIKERISFGEDDEDVAIAKASGHAPSGVKISLTHRGMSAFSFELVGNRTHKSYGKCSVTASIDKDDVIEYSSVGNDCYIRRVRGNTVTDLMDKVDITYNPWFNIPITEATTLTVTANKVGATQYVTAELDVEILDYYRSV